jgi:glycosidase
MTLLPGRPLLYNGQEIESPLKLRLFERDPIAWDIPGAAEALAFYRKVLDLARTHPAFLTGTLREIGTSAPDDIIAYQRDRVLVLVNARPHAVQLTVTGLAVDGSRDLLSDRIQAGDTIALPAFGTAVLELSRR